VYSPKLGVFTQLVVPEMGFRAALARFSLRTVASCSLTLMVVIVQGIARRFKRYRNRLGCLYAGILRNRKLGVE